MNEARQREDAVTVLRGENVNDWKADAQTQAERLLAALGRVAQLEDELKQAQRDRDVAAEGMDKWRTEANIATRREAVLRGRVKELEADFKKQLRLGTADVRAERDAAEARVAQLEEALREAKTAIGFCSGSCGGAWQAVNDALAAVSAEKP